MNAHPAFVFVRSAFSITSKSARITSSPVSSERRLAFVSRARSARRFRSLSASATSRSLEPKCWYRVRFVTPARAAIASTPVPVMPYSYVSSLVAARSASCAFGRSVMPVSIRTDRCTETGQYHSDGHEQPRNKVAQYTDRYVYYGSRITAYRTGQDSKMPLAKPTLRKGRSDEEK